MLNEGDAQAMRTWVVAANGWSHSAQRFVGAASELATVSRGVADRMDDATAPPIGSDGPSLSDQLRELADTVEHETLELRDRYLATAASIDEYASVIR
jgi:hypothetical protein